MRKADDGAATMAAATMNRETPGKRQAKSIPKASKKRASEKLRQSSIASYMTCVRTLNSTSGSPTQSDKSLKNINSKGGNPKPCPRSKIRENEAKRVNENEVSPCIPPGTDENVESFLAKITQENLARGGKPSRFWNMALYNYIRFPSMHKDSVLWASEAMRCVVVRDKYPKAKYHYLVLPLEDISSISELNSSHIPLLRRMDKAARAFISSTVKSSSTLSSSSSSSSSSPSSIISPLIYGDSISTTHEEGRGDGGGGLASKKDNKARERSPNVSIAGWRIGYHAIPSMKLLHLHVISTDFDSPCMKNRKHWQSFTTDGFFIDSSRLLAALTGCSEHAASGAFSGSSSGRHKHNAHSEKSRKPLDTAPSLRKLLDPKLATDVLKSQPLRCFHCRTEFPNIPKVKQHVAGVGAGGKCRIKSGAADHKWIGAAKNHAI